MTKYAVLLAILIINFVISQVGVFAGYSINGVAQGSAFSGENPGIFGIIEWVWDSISFMFNLATFQVDNVPAVIAGLFIIVQLMFIYLVVNLIRGS